MQPDRVFAAVRTAIYYYILPSALRSTDRITFDRQRLTQTSVGSCRDSVPTPEASLRSAESPLSGAWSLRLEPRLERVGPGFFDPTSLGGDKN